MAEIAANLADLQLNGTKLEQRDDSKYGLPLREVYRLAYSFYKEKEGKAVHFSYEDKLQLVAFAQQVSHGPYAEAAHKLTPLGILDVVGKDRRDSWAKLGNLPAEEARIGFVDLLSRLCPLFVAYVEAHKTEMAEKERRHKEAELKRLQEVEDHEKQQLIEKQHQEKLEREETLKRQIQQALNEQTYDQFRKYSEHQYPGDPEKQGALIRELQEQHYIQYMQQLQQAQLKEPQTEHTNAENSDLEQNLDSDEVQLVAPSMWTRPDILGFKKSVSEADGDGVVRVNHGETVTVRVPTHPEGSRLFWEFATDHFDIGFGVYFEFGTPVSDQVSVHVSESDDDDDVEDLDEEDYTEEVLDMELGPKSGTPRPLLTEIVPVYRRDCQNEVYVGSHNYPGKGVYLLKFDNSYSLWRSKTLYYRVYYTH